MKSHLRLVSTKDMTEEQWLSYRMCGLGGSDVGAVMGLSPYRSSIEVFYSKIGQYSNFKENLPMFLGSEQESFVKKLWTFWDGTPESVIENYRKGNIIRSAKRVNAFIHNPSYPWLYVSLDYEINKAGKLGNGALECKTINSWAANKFEAGFPPEYVTQVQTQLLVAEYSFGEAAVLKDNSDFFVLPFETHRGIQKSIIEVTKDFWDRVEKARIAMTRKYEAQRTFNYKVVEECEAEIQSLEPPPDNSQAYADFMKKKYNIANPGERIGSQEQFMIAVDHSKISDKIKKMEEKKRLFENQLKNFMKDGCDMLTFGETGYVSWKNDSNGSRRFLNKVK